MTKKEILQKRKEHRFVFHNENHVVCEKCQSICSNNEQVLLDWINKSKSWPSTYFRNYRDGLYIRKLGKHSKYRISCDYTDEEWEIAKILK